MTLLFFARRGSCGSLISVQINIKQCGPLSTCKSSVSALYLCTESSQSLCTQLKVATVIYGSSRLIGAVSYCVKAPCRLCVHTFSHVGSVLIHLAIKGRIFVRQFLKALFKEDWFPKGIECSSPQLFRFCKN